MAVIPKGKGLSGLVLVPMDTEEIAGMLRSFARLALDVSATRLMGCQVEVPNKV